MPRKNLFVYLDLQFLTHKFNFSDVPITVTINRTEDLRHEFIEEYSSKYVVDFNRRSVWINQSTFQSRSLYYHDEIKSMIFQSQYTPPFPIIKHTFLGFKNSAVHPICLNML